MRLIEAIPTSHHSSFYDHWISRYLRFYCFFWSFGVSKNFKASKLVLKGNFTPREPTHTKSCTNNGNALEERLRKENPLSKPLLEKPLKKPVSNYMIGNQNSVSMIQNLIVMYTLPIW